MPDQAKTIFAIWLCALLLSPIVVHSTAVNTDINGLNSKQTLLIEDGLESSKSTQNVDSPSLKALKSKFEEHVFYM